MSSSSEILGAKEVAARLLSMKNDTFRRVVEAVERTAVKMANSAKAGHEHGSDPHSRDRFETQTGNLVSSISPGNSGEMQWEKLTENEVVGLFGILSTGPSTALEYAPLVEERYPFIWPAVVANMDYFREQMKLAAPGGSGTVKV
ncbi:MAG: hypothetical protein ABFE01_11025 [Phycisphaerales bacterium]|jgi:hypothetical protein